MVDRLKKSLEQLDPAICPKCSIEMLVALNASRRGNGFPSFHLHGLLSYDRDQGQSLSNLTAKLILRGSVILHGHKDHEPRIGLGG